MFKNNIKLIKLFYCILYAKSYKTLNIKNYINENDCF